MKIKTSRMEALKMLISSQELGSQEEVLQALAKEGYTVTQATLSRDLKQLKVAKAASMNGRYVYVLPNETMYKRVPNPRSAREMLMTSGFTSINFSGNMIVIKTRPGYASSIAYNIDNSDIPQTPFFLLRKKVRARKTSSTCWQKSSPTFMVKLSADKNY